MGVADEVDLVAGGVAPVRLEVGGHHAGGAAEEGEDATAGHHPLALLHQALVAAFGDRVDDLQRVTILSGAPLGQPFEAHGDEP